MACHRFRGNEARLWLSILVYNLGNFWRRLALPSGIEDWSLASVQQRLVKTGGRLGKAFPVLPADAGGSTPDARVVRRDATADRDPAASGKLTAGGIERKSNP